MGDEETGMIDEEAAEAIVNAIHVSEISEMDAEEIDVIAILAYTTDPDITFDELGLSRYATEAGAKGHGSNTEEEMLAGAAD